MSNPEDEYFARIEAEKKARLKKKLDGAASEQDLKARKEQYWHKCGKCGGDMKTEVYRGVEVEICPDCGAVLLDPGELQVLAGHDGSGFLSGLFGFNK